MEEKRKLEKGIDYLDYSDEESFKSFNKKKWYINDLIEVPLPDPQVLYYDGIYYIVGTCDRNISVIDCYTTKDFIEFEHHKEIYNPSMYNGWEANKPAIFAPEMYEFNNKFYLYYSAKDKYGIRRMSVVISDNPLGPYQPIITEDIDGLNNPLFAFENRNALDATIFKDDDNLYMYYVVEGVPQYILGVQLLNPYTALPDTIKELVKPGFIDSTFSEKGLYWEEFRNNDYKIAEAPFMLKSNGKYYLTYSVNGCWNKFYNVCYAVSDFPLGNFIKPYEEGKIWTNLLMGYPGDNNVNSLLAKQWEGFASGTAHHSFFTVGNELMIAYHSQQNRSWNEENWSARYLAIDYVYFDENGLPFINGPTYSLVPLPTTFSGLTDISKKALVKTKNVNIETNIINDHIVKYYNLETFLEEVLLGNGISCISFEFDKEYLIEGIVIYNSAYYEKIINEIYYIDFGDEIIFKPKLNDFYIKKDLKFVFPNSAFTIELLKQIKTKKIAIYFNLPNGGNINNIKILAKA